MTEPEATATYDLPRRDRRIAQLLRRIPLTRVMQGRQSAPDLHHNRSVRQVARSLRVTRKLRVMKNTLLRPNGQKEPVAKSHATETNQVIVQVTVLIERTSSAVSRPHT
jgi:hypothetical protein